MTIQYCGSKLWEVVGSMKGRGERQGGKREGGERERGARERGCKRVRGERHNLTQLKTHHF